MRVRIRLFPVGRHRFMHLFNLSNKHLHFVQVFVYFKNYLYFM